VRPTARGAGLAAGAAVLVVAGVALHYPELAVLGTAAVAALVGAAGHVAVRPGLTVARTAEPDRVSRGEPCEQTLRVATTSRWRTATLLARDRCGPASVPVPLVRLRPRRDTTLRYPVPTHRRGVVDVGPLWVTRRDPLGLLTVTRRYGDPARVWVHPRAHPLTAVPTGTARSLDGRVDRVPHGSITFDTLRDYVIGDELRHVHWRTTAKVGALMVREHVDTSLPRIVVLLDDRAGTWPAGTDGFEAACEAAASVIVAAARDELAVRLLLVAGAPGGAALPQPGPVPPAGALLDALAEADPAVPDPDALAATVRLLRQHRRGDTVVYLTGAGHPGELALIASLRPVYPSVVAGVFGVPDAEASTVEGVHVLAVPDAVAFAAAWDGVGQW